MDESAAQLFAAAVENVKEALAISETSPAASQPSIASSLPDKSSTGGKYTARSAKACDRCYSRKIRCVESGSEDPLAPCKRCESAGAACTFGQPEYRRSRKKAVVESDKNAATINSVGNARYDNSFQNMEVSNSVGNSSSEGDLASHFLQLLMTQMASGGSADELKRNFGLDSIFTSNGASYPIAMPQTGTKEIMSNGLPPFLTPALQFGGSFKSDTSPEPFISFGAQPANFHGRDSSFLSLLGAGFPQTPSMQMPTPLLQSPTPVVEPPHYLLSLRQKDELIDAYFNFINPSMPFLHPGHFWNQYKGGRIPGFLLDAMFGVAVRYMNPRVKRPDSFGMSLYTLSQRDIHRSESPSFAESPNSATSELERSWSDVEYGEFVILQTHLRDRALEWFPKLRERQASISLVHTMIILSLMETSRAGHWLESDSLKTTAIEMATQLSLNVDLPGKPFEVNTRRRTWWCIVILEVNMAFGNGFETKLPVSCNPSFPEVSPEDGSATGPWSPEATRSFIATADLSRLMVKELRAADSSGNRTDEYLDLLREWEARHAQALQHPRPSNNNLLSEQEIYPWVLSTSANVSKYAAILICLRPAALAFQLGAEEGQDWSAHIRHKLARKFRPSYSTWIATQNAAHAITEVAEKTPYQVLNRIPLLNVMAFPAIALSFQTLLHSTDLIIRTEAGKMISKLCSRLSGANPWGLGLIFERITDFCLRFANLYMKHNKVSVYAPIIEQSKRRPTSPFICAPEQAQSAAAVDTESSTSDETSSNLFKCDGLFMEQNVYNEKPKNRDWSKPAKPEEITIGDFTEVQISLMGPLYEVRMFISKHLDIPKEVYET